MKSDRFLCALDALQAGGPLRVWSLIVTVFGDMARDDGGTISGPVLTEILTPLGVKPEALRVALHRLRNEGWLSAEKQGRMSFHKLTERGRRESGQASERIYRRDYPAAGTWHLRCCAPESRLPDGYVPLASGVGLSNTSAPEIASEDFLFEGRIRALPAWIMQACLPKGLESEFRDLDAAMDIVLAEISALAQASGLQSACLRTAIVHQWRRLVLKVPDVPDAFFPDDWIGFSCRAKVHAALDLLPKPGANELR
ncbi:MAG: PaaX family transcriptional regulator C-terminal domain-containing protein [Pseudomonadota bacterium]